MTEFFDICKVNNIFLIFIILCCIYFIIYNFIIPNIRKYHKPKFRCNKEHLIEYYSIYFNEWRTLFIWNNIYKQRIIHIYDTIHGLEFDHKYFGEGKEGIYFDNIDEYKDKFKNNIEIDKNQISLIEKEDSYLKHIFMHDNI